MENQLLKKSGTIAAIVTFALLGTWFGFSKLSPGLDTSDWTPHEIKKNSVVSEQLIIMCGTSGSGIVFGTTSGAWVGTPTDSTLARIFFNTATGRLEFKPSGTTTSFPFGSVTVAYLDDNYATIGSVSTKLNATGGVGTGNTFNNTTLAGQGSITATFNANGLDITPAEYASVNNATSELQAQINTKQATLGYIPLSNNAGSITAALGAQSINALSDVNIVMNENDFVKISGGQLVSGSSTATVAFSAVTGSATASQLPLISGLLGSATASQLPPGQLSGQSSIVPLDVSSDYGLLLKCDNAGTTTFTDSSITPKTITAQGSAIGTSTTILEAGSYLGDGASDALMINDHADLTLGTGDFTIGWTFQFNNVADYMPYRQNDGAGNYIYINYANNFSGTNDIIFAAFVSSVAKADYRCEFNSPSTGTNYHFEFARNGSNFYIFINGISQSLTITTAIGTNNLSDITANLYLMAKEDLTVSLNGKMDGFYLIKGRALHTINFTPPTRNYPDYEEFTQYSTKYKDPVNGNTTLNIVTPGTATAQASYIYNTATTTVFGLDTNTAIIATSTAYSGWFAGAVRATAFNVASTEKIKENIKPIKIKPDLLEAESMAKQNYIAGAKVAWMAANQSRYTTIVSETGTGSVTVIDTSSMETDYNNYIELAWATDMNQNTYIKNVQKIYEKGFWQMFDSVTPRSWNPKDKPTLIRKGFVVEDMPDVVRGDDGQSIDPMALIAYMAVVHKSMKADTVFALNTLKELITTGTVTQQKIEYVQDRLEVLNP